LAGNEHGGAEVEQQLVKQLIVTGPQKPDKGDNNSKTHKF